MPDPILILPVQLQYEQDGDTITQLPHPEYSEHLADEVATIKDTVADHDTQLTSLATDVADALTQLGTPPVPETMTAEEVMGDVDLHEIPDILHEVVIQFDALRELTGLPADLQDVIDAEPTGLKDQPTLAAPGTMTGIPGWVDSPVNLGETLQNMWLTIDDIRKAMFTLLPASVACDDVTVEFTAVHDAVAGSIVINLYGMSSVPIGTIQNTAIDSMIEIEDGNGVKYYRQSNTLLNSITANVPINISLSGTGLNPSTDYIVTIHHNFILSGGEICSDTVTNDPVVNQAAKCLNISVVPGETTAVISMYSTTLGADDYDVEVLKDSDNSVVYSQTYSGFSTSFSTVVSGLTSGTLYRIETTTNLGATAITCAPVYFTTVTP